MTPGSPARKVLQTLIAARKALSTYPAGHAMQAQSLEAFRQCLEHFDLEQGPATLRVQGADLLVGAELVSGEDDLAAELLDEMSERRFQSLGFESGVTIEELGEFLTLMTRPVREIIMAGGYPQAFEETGIHRIRPQMAASPVFDEEGGILVNGQRLSEDMLKSLEHPDLVQRLIRKLVALQADDAGEGLPSDAPLEEVLKNMDRIVQEQILNGVSAEDVVDSLVTPEGLQRFRMEEGSSGLETDLNEAFENLDHTEEQVLFLVELMRTMPPGDRYGQMVGDFVRHVNELVASGGRSELLSRLLVFMLEERRDDARRQIFNQGMGAMELDAMVDFVFTRLDRTGTFEQVILGTMLRSFGPRVAELVLDRYLESEDDWTRDVALAALIHGSRHSETALRSLDSEILTRKALELTRLCLGLGDWGVELLERMATGEPEQRGRFYWALGKIKDERALPWLKRALEEEDAELRKTGLSQLEHFEDEASVDMLIEFLDRWESGGLSTKVVDEACLAINALARLKAQRALPRLQSFAEQRAWFFDGESKMIKSYAKFAIQKIVT